MLEKVNGILMDVVGPSGEHAAQIYDHGDVFRRYGPMSPRLAAEITRLADPDSISPALWKEIAEVLIKRCGLLDQWLNGECRSAG